MPFSNALPALLYLSLVAAHPLEAAAATPHVYREWRKRMAAKKLGACIEKCPKSHRLATWWFPSSPRAAEAMLQRLPPPGPNDRICAPSQFRPCGMHPAFAKADDPLWKPQFVVARVRKVLRPCIVLTATPPHGRTNMCHQPPLHRGPLFKNLKSIRVSDVLQSSAQCVLSCALPFYPMIVSCHTMDAVAQSASTVSDDQ